MISIPDRAIAVIYQEGKLLMMWRYHKQTEFYSFIGGTKEDSELIEDTLVREVFEEVNLEVNSFHKIFEYDHKYQIESDGKIIDVQRHEHYFFVDGFKGEIKLGYEELARQSKDNIYRPDWLDLNYAYKIEYDPMKIWEIIDMKVNK